MATKRIRSTAFLLVAWVLTFTAACSIIPARALDRQNCFSPAYHASTDCDRLAAPEYMTWVERMLCGEKAEASHWAYLRSVFTGVDSPYLIPVTGHQAP